MVECVLFVYMLHSIYSDWIFALNDNMRMGYDKKLCACSNLYFVNNINDMQHIMYLG